MWGNGTCCPIHDVLNVSDFVSTQPKKGLIDFDFPQRIGSKDGFMVDVWWGITEPKPKEYNFAPYRRLIDEDCPMFGPMMVME